MPRRLLSYITRPCRGDVNLPGTGDTVIKQAVPPGGDSALHLAVLKPAISQTGRLGCIIFGRGGLRSRIPRPITNVQTAKYCCVRLMYVRRGVRRADVDSPPCLAINSLWECGGDALVATVHWLSMPTYTSVLMTAL